MTGETKTFESWAIVEIMGHRQFAGYVTEQALGGASFVRVDVPSVQADGEELPAFTKLLGAGSIYAISPCTEETARAFAAQSRQRSFSVYEAPRLTSSVETTLEGPEDRCSECRELVAECTCEYDDDDQYDEP